MAQKTACPTCGRELEAVKHTGEFTVPAQLIAAESVQFNAPRTPAPSPGSCSYCGKTAEQVKRILTGQGAQICDECVSLCYMVLSDELPGFQ